jgi:hypothetical protein
MKRDMDLAKLILEQVEEKSKGIGTVVLNIPDYSPDEVSYHVKILCDGGFLEATNASTMHGLDWVPKSLTWPGHEFLDAIRNDSVWKKVKEKVKEYGGKLSFAIIKNLAIKFAAEGVGL